MTLSKPHLPLVTLERGRPSRAGFTLIEMMVVIAIISLLVALIVPTIGAVREKARLKATRTLVDVLAAGLERYLVDFDEFPPSTSDELGDTPVPDSLYLYLCGAEGRGLIKITGEGSNALKQHVEAYVVPPPEYLKKVGAQTFIIDSWGMEVTYLNCRAYTERMRAANPGYVDDGKCHNPMTFDLYSMGSNRAKDPDPLNLVDDITNWK